MKRKFTIMMKKLSIRHLQPAEILETATRYQTAIVDSTLDESFISRVITLLETDKINLQGAISAIRTNSYVDDVSDADDLRDDLYVSFRDMVAAYKRRKGDTMKNAYQAVWPILEQAGTQLYRLGYTQQSGQMQALFTELDKAAAQDAITTLGLLDLYSELKQSQEDFVAVYTDRLEEDAQKNYPTLREARSKILPHLNILISAMGILLESEPETWQTVADQFNAITTEMMSIASNRKTRKQEDQESENKTSF